MELIVEMMSDEEENRNINKESSDESGDDESNNSINISTNISTNKSGDEEEETNKSKDASDEESGDEESGDEKTNKSDDEESNNSMNKSNNSMNKSKDAGDDEEEEEESDEEEDEDIKEELKELLEKYKRELKSKQWDAKTTHLFKFTKCVFGVICKQYLLGSDSDQKIMQAAQLGRQKDYTFNPLVMLNCLNPDDLNRFRTERKMEDVAILHKLYEIICLSHKEDWKESDKTCFKVNKGNTRQCLLIAFAKNLLTTEDIIPVYFQCSRVELFCVLYLASGKAQKRLNDAYLDVLECLYKNNRHYRSNVESFLTRYIKENYPQSSRQKNLLLAYLTPNEKCKSRKSIGGGQRERALVMDRSYFDVDSSIVSGPGEYVPKRTPGKMQKMPSHFKFPKASSSKRVAKSKSKSKVTSKSTTSRKTNIASPIPRIASPLANTTVSVGGDNNDYDDDDHEMVDIGGDEHPSFHLDDTPASTMHSTSNSQRSRYTGYSSVPSQAISEAVASALSDQRDEIDHLKEELQRLRSKMEDDTGTNAKKRSRFDDDGEKEDLFEEGPITGVVRDSTAYDYLFYSLTKETSFESLLNDALKYKSRAWHSLKTICEHRFPLEVRPRVILTLHIIFCVMLRSGILNKWNDAISRLPFPSRTKLDLTFVVSKYYMKHMNDNEWMNNMAIFIQDTINMEDEKKSRRAATQCLRYLMKQFKKSGTPKLKRTESHEVPLVASPTETCI